jgi:hypothetical protein
MMIYLTAIGFATSGNSIVHINTKTIHRTTHLTNKKGCGPCPVIARCTLAYALQLKKKHGKTSVRVAGECQLAKKYTEQRILVNKTIRIHNLQN